LKLLGEDWLREAETRLEQRELKRRELSDLSYDLIRKCGLLVSSLHRGSPDAEAIASQAKSLHQKLLEEVRRDPSFLLSEEEAAFSEYAEASSLFSLLKNGELSSPGDFYNEEVFLLGLADLIGELKRLLINSIIIGERDRAMVAFEWMQELFDDLVRFEYPRSVVRGLKRKLDVDRALIEDAREVLARSKRKTVKRWPGLPEMEEVVPITYDGDVLSLLDQRLLPFQESWVVCRNATDTAGAIRDMVVRGAPAIGVAAAYGAAMEIKQAVNSGEGLSRIESRLSELLNARPTAYNLSYAVNRVLSAARSAQQKGEDPAAAAEEEAKLIDQENRRAADDMGKIGAALISDGDTVMTICNTGALAVGYLGTALGVIKTAWRQGKKIHVIALETRPWLQGSRLTVYELQKEGIPFTLIVDGASAITMKNKGVSSVFVGADRIVSDGSTANKIGTFTLSIVSKYFGVPFYVVAPLSTVQLDSRDIKVEERSPTEVTELRGIKISTAGDNVYNPVFDITPPENITAIITEKGIARPPFERSLRQLKRG